MNEIPKCPTCGCLMPNGECAGFLGHDYTIHLDPAAGVDDAVVVYYPAGSQPDRIIVSPGEKRLIDAITVYESEFGLIGSPSGKISEKQFYLKLSRLLAGSTWNWRMRLRFEWDWLWGNR
ncbi:MAG TPA: hypothetical protein VNN79_08040 [Actinomycetota bacterium]|nr:hypothetical protein [Actinomycetota bacterium]